MNNTTPPPMPSLQPKSGIPDVLFMIIFIAGLVYKGIGVITSSLSSFMIFGGFMDSALEESNMLDSFSYLKVTVPISIICMLLGIVGLIMLLRKNKLGFILFVISIIVLLATDISTLFMMDSELAPAVNSGIAIGSMVLKHFLNVVIIVFGYLAVRQRWAK